MYTAVCGLTFFLRYDKRFCLVKKVRQVFKTFSIFSDFYLYIDGIFGLSRNFIKIFLAVLFIFSFSVKAYDFF